MITVADLIQHLEQFPDDVAIVLRADTERELYDDPGLLDMRERLSFEPVSLVLADDVDYWEPDNGDTDRLRTKALAWKGPMTPTRAGMLPGDGVPARAVTSDTGEDHR